MTKEEKLQAALDRLNYDKEYIDRGCNCLAGTDEAGRGPLAGPVVAACVVLDYDNPPLEANDSKKLSEKKREALYEKIMAEARYVGIGVAHEKEIDELNILRASMLAMRRAAEQSRAPADMLLADGNCLPGALASGREKAIVGGDGLSLCIGAASVIAKVTRDRLMLEYAGKYPQYGFDKHKGYGTAQHMAMIEKYGPCPIHRRTFLKLKEKGTGVRERGALAEEAACGYLQAKGYKILARNYTVPGGEIDIIAEINGITVFAEVKHRTGFTVGTGAEGINAAKIKTLRRAALTYLTEHKLTGMARFDVIELTGPLSGADIRHIENAFE